MNEAASVALRKHSKSRTASVVAKIRGAMKLIEVDVDQNDGVYPFNGGRVSKAELCRRAGIHKVTLQNPSHRTSTRALIDAWLKKLSTHLVSGKKSVRRTVTTRADSWREKYLAAVNQTNLYHLQMVSLRDRADSATARAQELEAEVVRLQSLLSDGRVVGIRKRTR